MFNNNKFCLDKAFPQTQFFSLFFVLVFTLFVTACSGTGASKEEGVSQVSPDGTTLYLKLVDGNNVLVRDVNQDSTVTVVATLKSPGDDAISGEVVEFSTDLGALAATNGLTDSAGRVAIDLSSGVSPKAGKVTARVSVDGVDITVSYGFAVEGAVDLGPGNSPTPGANPDISLDVLPLDVATPDQNSMSLSLSNVAPEAWLYDGVEVDVTVHLGDQFNQYAADGRVVYFSTEGGGN